MSRATDELKERRQEAKEQANKSNTPILVSMSDIVPEDIKWLWHPYIARETISMLDGDPGVGKSLFTMQLAANISKGNPLPDQQGKPNLETVQSDVLILAAEDSAEHTIRPRLDRAEADCSRIKILTGFTDESQDIQAFTLQHMDVLIKAMEDVMPTLVIIDPLQAYLGPIDMHRANETRPLMTALAKASQRFHASILCVRHLAKPGGGGKSIHRGLGSIDFVGAARTTMIVESHPIDRDKTLFMHNKSNIGIKGRTQIFSKDDGAFTWAGVSRVDAETICGNGRGPDPYAMLQILFWLEKHMAGGTPRPSAEILDELKEEGFKLSTINSAKKALGIISTKNGDTWNWRLPSLDIIPSPTTTTITKEC